MVTFHIQWGNTITRMAKRLKVLVYPSKPSAVWLTWGCGVHHSCIHGNWEILLKDTRRAVICGWIHLHAVVQSVSPTGLQRHQQEIPQSHTQEGGQSAAAPGLTPHRSVCLSGLHVCASLTCMRNTLVLFSMHLLSKYVKIRDSWTRFPSDPNTQPSSPWDDRTARKQSSTGRWLSARHTHTHTHY